VPVTFNPSRLIHPYERQGLKVTARLLLDTIVLTCLCIVLYHAVVKFMDTNTMPHLLLYGPPGTGKTSTILACARKLYGDQYKALTLEASLQHSVVVCC